MQKDLVIRGAKENNLKGIDVTIPRDRLVVLTGLSGSGKSSLAFDTIYAEGQRRYVESLSAYARQFLGQLDKPDVESIEAVAGHLHRPEDHQQEPQVHCGDRHRDLRLPAADVCPDRHSPLSGLRTRSVPRAWTRIVGQLMSLDEGTKGDFAGAGGAKAQGRARKY